MTATPGIFEVFASDQHDVRLASRRALVLSRDRLDARLGKFLSAARSPEEFDARYELVADDFVGIVRVAAGEVGHEDPNSLIETLHAHYKKSSSDAKCLRCKGSGKVNEGECPSCDGTGKEGGYGDVNESEKEFGKSGKKSKKNKKKDKKDKDDDFDDDEGDDSLEFAAKTAGVAPFRRTGEFSGRTKSGELIGPYDTEEEFERELAAANKEYDDEEGDSKESSVRVADNGKGNTGLAGPSPKMDKKRWTPKSVKPIDVPSERHPTVQKDITEIMPKKNEGPPGDAHNIEEIWSLTTTETLPTGTGLDDAGFAGNNQDMAPHTKTFGDGGQTDPVKSESLEA